MTLSNINKSEQWIYRKVVSVNSRDFYFAGFGGTFYVNIGTGSTYARGRFTAAAAGITNGVPFDLSIVYDGSKSTNATRLEVYVNRVKLTLAFDGAAIPEATYNLAAANFDLNHPTTTKFAGSVDELWIKPTSDHEKRTMTIQKNLNHNTSPFYVEGAIQYTTTANGTTNAPIVGGGAPKPYGTYDTLVMTPASGYGGRLAGRAMVLYPNRDTLIVQVLKDSTVTSLAFLIPVIIDSAICKRRRNVNLDFFRISDTGTVKFNEIHDSAVTCTLWLNSGMTIQVPILNWFNNVYPAIDSIRFKIPNSVPLNYYYRMRLIDQYGIKNDSPTKHTLSVIGQVR